jgi:hypothetical protein
MGMLQSTKKHEKKLTVAGYQNTPGRPAPESGGNVAPGISPNAATSCPDQYMISFVSHIKYQGENAYEALDN